MPAPESMHRMAVVMAADIAGYTRLMRSDEIATSTRLQKVFSDIVNPAIASSDGTMVKYLGDGFLAEFRSASSALTAAVTIQNDLEAAEQSEEPERRLRFRIGVNIADVIVRDNDIFGDGVNIAARLQAEAEPGGIAVSRGIRDQLSGRGEFKFTAGELRRLKNIDEPIMVHFLTSTSYRAHRGKQWKILAGVALLGAIVAAALLVDWTGIYDRVVRSPHAAPKVAVMPFHDRSGGTDRDILADAIPEELIIDLSRFSEFSVLARNSTFSLTDRDMSPKEVLSTLGAQYVIEGSVRRAGDTIRVSAQLQDTRDGNVVWAERIEASAQDLFSEQTKFARQIVGLIAPEISRTDVERVATRPPESLAAWELYARARGLFFNSFTADSSAQALSYLQRAQELDPRYAPAFALAGYIRAFQWMYRWGENFEGRREDGLALANRAVELEPTNGIGYWSRCHVLRFIEPRRALPHCEKSVELNPNSTDYLATYAFALDWARELEKSLEVVRRAIELSPRAPELDIYYFFEAHALFHLKRYEESIEVVDSSASAMRAPLWKGWMAVMKASCLAELGRTEEANVEVKKVMELMPFASLQWMEKTFTRAPLHPKSREEQVSALRKAGLPETR
jgi:adenylate cyclase